MTFALARRQLISLIFSRALSTSVPLCFQTTGMLSKKRKKKIIDPPKKPILSKQAESPYTSEEQEAMHERYKGPIGKAVEKKLTEQFEPKQLTVRNISNRFVFKDEEAPWKTFKKEFWYPALCKEETHYEVTIVSEKFSNQSVLQRHRLVYGAIKRELEGPVLQCLHIYAWTPAEHKHYVDDLHEYFEERSKVHEENEKQRYEDIGRTLQQVRENRRRRSIEKEQRKAEKKRTNKAFFFVKEAERAELRQEYENERLAAEERLLKLAVDKDRVKREKYESNQQDRQKVKNVKT